MMRKNEVQYFYTALKNLHKAAVEEKWGEMAYFLEMAMQLAAEAQDADSSK